jgi:hypothetical protein
MDQQDHADADTTGDLEAFWGNMFSGEPARIRAAWADLRPDEQTAVVALLERIQADPERLAEQRAAAVLALQVIAEA